MKALTLHQPWASLVALGAKMIETRSWSTKYRGPLAIHAGRGKADPTDPIWNGLVVPDSALLVPQLRPLVFGSVVATVELTDVYPIVDPSDFGDDLNGARTNGNGFVFVTPERLEVWKMSQWSHQYECRHRIGDDRPYGDFTSGRFAWMLADVKPLREPVPARGKQRLWNWDGNGLFDPAVMRFQGGHHA